MALNNQYCGVNDVILAMGGTGGRLDISTSGTSAIGTMQVGSLIMWCSDIVDLYLVGLVGTAGLGTTPVGTAEIPNVIRQCVAKMAAAETMKTLLTGNAPETSAWAKDRYDEAIALLEKFQGGILQLPGIATSESELPKATNLTFMNRAEVVSFTGTEIQALQYERALPGSEKVYSTHVASGGTVWTRGTDYVFYGWNVGTTGQNSAALRRVGTNIPTGADLYVDYEVWTDKFFTTPADHKASRGAGGEKRPMGPGFTSELMGDLSGNR